MTSGSVDKVALGFLLEAAVAKLAPFSRSQPGFLSALNANFLPTLAKIFPKFLKKLPSLSACIVLSETVRDFF